MAPTAADSSEPTPDLLGLGAHCSTCNQLDFLPFRCAACGRIHCLEHRHACPCGASSATLGSGALIVVCPLCTAGIRVAAGEDPNAAFEHHSRAGAGECNPAKRTKPRCPARGCKEKLTTVNTYACKTCCASVCLKHRLADDHQCAGAAPAAAKARAAADRRVAAANASAALRGFGDRAADLFGAAKRGAGAAASGAAAAARRAASAAAAAASSAADPANTVHGSADRRRVMPGLPTAAAAERCPQCGAQFADVVALIAHVEAAHAGGGGGAALVTPAAAAAAPHEPAAASALYRCHRCGAAAPDAVTLVEHDARCAAAAAGGGGGRAGGGGAQKDNCVVC